jgi:hypothetical protein
MSQAIVPESKCIFIGLGNKSSGSHCSDVCHFEDVVVIVNVDGMISIQYDLQLSIKRLDLGSIPDQLRK